jgi:hypothetical protein
LQVAWEPLLEPYSFTLDLEQSANEAATGKVESEVRVQVASAAILNVNITEGLVKVSLLRFFLVSTSFFYLFLFSTLWRPWYVGFERLERREKEGITVYVETRM